MPGSVKIAVWKWLFVKQQTPLLACCWVVQKDHCECSDLHLGSSWPRRLYVVQIKGFSFMSVVMVIYESDPAPLSTIVIALFPFVSR